MKLRDYINIVWRRRLLVALAAILGAVAVYLVGQPPEPGEPEFSGQVTVATKPDELPTSVLRFSRIVSATPEISTLVAAELGDEYFGPDVPTAEYLEGSVWVEATPDIGTLIIYTEGQDSREDVIAILDGYSRHLVEYSRNLNVLARDAELESLALRQASVSATIDQLEDELDALEALQTEEERARGVSPDRVKSALLDSNVGILTEIDGRIDDLRNRTDEELTPLTLLGTIDIASAEPEGSPLSYQQRMIVGVVLATLLGVGLAFALHRVDSRLYNRKDTEAAFGLPVLSEIPRLGWLTRRRKGTLLTRTHTSSPFAESHRLLRSGLAHTRMLQLERLGRPGASFGTVTIIASAEASTGKTTTAANLAVAAVDSGRSVLLISADLRKPELERLLEVEAERGLTDAVKELQTTGQLNLDQYLVPTSVPGITLLPCGSSVPNPGETLALIGPLVEAVKSRYDTILIDSPPMLVGNDVSELVPFAELILVVARAGKTTIDEAEWLEETASRLEAPTCGVALVGARSELERRDGSLVGRLLGPLRRSGDDDEAESAAPIESPLPAPVAIPADGMVVAASAQPAAPVTPPEVVPSPAPGSAAPAPPVADPIVAAPPAPAAHIPVAGDPAASGPLPTGTPAANESAPPSPPATSVPAEPTVTVPAEPTVTVPTVTVPAEGSAAPTDPTAKAEGADAAARTPESESEPVADGGDGGTDDDGFAIDEDALGIDFDADLDDEDELTSSVSSKNRSGSLRS